MKKFKLYDEPINSFRNKIVSFTNKADIFKKELKENFPEVFSGGLKRCNKMFAKFELQENVTPVLKRKRNVPFASMTKINDEWIDLRVWGYSRKLNIANGPPQ